MLVPVLPRPTVLPEPPFSSASPSTSGSAELQRSRLPPRLPQHWQASVALRRHATRESRLGATGTAPAPRATRSPWPCSDCAAVAKCVRAALPKASESARNCTEQRKTNRRREALHSGFCSARLSAARTHRLRPAPAARHGDACEGRAEGAALLGRRRARGGAPRPPLRRPAACRRAAARR